MTNIRSAMRLHKKNTRKICFIVWALLAGSVDIQAQMLHESDIVVEKQTHAYINRKSKEIKTLTRNAARHFAVNALDTACRDFVHNPVWRKGELFVFVFNEQGVCLAYGDDTDLIWKNISSVKGVGDRPLIEEMLAIGSKGGRLTYLWDNAYKSSYIQVVTKGGVRYVLGSGFFPESDEYTTQQLVKTAAAYFYARGREAAFSRVSNPNGPFIRGDIYMFIYDFRGVCVAHGENAALIGQNLIDIVDSRGTYVVRGLIDVARRGKGHGWFEYIWRNEFKRAYVERVVDPKTKKPYLVAAGYYPRVTLQTTRSFVNRAIRHIKSAGSKEAFADFTNQAGEFMQGGLTIFVLDFEGKCLANGDNPEFVGQNLLKRTDQQGRFIYQEIIDRMKQDQRALIPFVTKNAYTVAYVERIDVPDGKFIVGAEYHPDSKAQSTQSLVDRAGEYLAENNVTKEQAFRAFSTKDGGFFRGDLSIFVYNTQGTRLVNGTQTTQLWRNFLKTPDEAGRLVVGDIIATAMQGGGWVEYAIRNTKRRVYARAVEKPDPTGQLQTFIVGSGYYF
jgi:cytochrome c